MSERKSLLLYTEFWEEFQLLTDEEAGQVIKALFLVERGENPAPPTGAAGVLFSVLKRILTKDQEKYRAVCERNRENGKKGGRPRKEQTPSHSQKPKKADKEKDKEKDKDKEQLPPLTPPGEEAFERFWDAYPKKTSKAKAREAWLRLKPDEELTEKILKGLEESKSWENWKVENGRYIPAPAHWLENERWEDRPTQVPLSFVEQMAYFDLPDI